MENPVDARLRPQAEGDLTMKSVTKIEPWRSVWLALSLVIALIAVAVWPAAAHKDRSKEPVPVAAPRMDHTASPGAPASDHGQTAAMPAMTGMDMPMDRSKLPFFERLFQWFGRLHPAIVHFPIAFFPAALLTALAGRRRPAFSAPVQFLVVAGGLFAPIAAAAGWVNGLTADPEPILAYHRWLGVAIGVGGAALAVWAWRRPWEDRGVGMILALTAMTIAIAIQGFLGAGLTHGIDHLMF